MLLVHANVRERLSMRVYDRRGRVSKRHLHKFYRFMRCRRTGKRKRIAWRLIRNLYSISRAFGGKPLRIYSGYRHPRVSRLRRSYHGRGQAVDFRVAGVSNRRLRDHIRKTFKRVGVGYYPNSLFVHMDVRNKSAFWVDASGPGENPEYVNAYETLRAERSKNKVACKSKEKARPAPAAAIPKSKPAAVANAATTKETIGPGVKTVGEKSPSPSPPSPPAPVAGPPPVGPSPEPIDDPAPNGDGPKGNGPKAAPPR